MICIFVETFDPPRTAVKGFLACLLSDKRPLHALLKPNLREERRNIFKNEFEGMIESNSKYHFTFEHHMETLNKLIEEVRKSLTQKEKEFLLSFVKREIFSCWPDTQTFFNVLKTSLGMPSGKSTRL